jgi:hypothetical protein
MNADERKCPARLRRPWTKSLPWSSDRDLSVSGARNAQSMRCSVGRLTRAASECIRGRNSLRCGVVDRQAATVIGWLAVNENRSF